MPITIDDLLELGDDQISSQFEVTFTSVPGGGDGNLLTIRLQGDFDPPNRETETYEIWYQGMKIVRTSIKDATTKELTMIFRLDQNWKVFDALNGWYELVYNETTGTAAQSDKDLRTDINFNALGINKVIVKTLIYVGAKIRSVKLSTFGQENSDPANVESVFIYHKHQFE